MSSWNETKDLIEAILHLSKDAIHIYIGFLVLLGTLVLLRRPITSPIVLLPGLIVSCAVELLDSVPHFLSTHHVHWDATLHDVFNTNLMPTLLVIVARWGWLKGQSPRDGDVHVPKATESM